MHQGAGGRQFQGLMIAIGINERGNREILGFCSADSETEAGWTAFFRELKARGLSQLEMVVSDSHKGLVQSVKQCFQGAMWQRCQTHISLNMLDTCPMKLQPEMRAALKSLYEADDHETAVLLEDSMISRFQQEAPKSANLLEESFEDVMAVCACRSPCAGGFEPPTVLSGSMRRSAVGNESSVSSPMRNLCYS